MDALFSSLGKLFHSAARKRADFAAAAASFMEQNRGAFILLADPDTDCIFMAYRGITVPVRMTHPDGTRMHIVSNALKYSKVEKSVDQFLLVVDSGLVNIAQSLHTKRREAAQSPTLPFEERAQEQAEEGITSPIQLGG